MMSASRPFVQVRYTGPQKKLRAPKDDDPHDWNWVPPGKTITVCDAVVLDDKFDFPDPSDEPRAYIVGYWCVETGASATCTVQR